MQEPTYSHLCLHYMFVLTLDNDIVVIYFKHDDSCCGFQCYVLKETLWKKFVWLIMLNNLILFRNKFPHHAD